LLANLYMNRFLKYWRITGRGEIFKAQVVNYADDFVILSRQCGRGAELDAECDDTDWTHAERNENQHQGGTHRAV